MARLEGDLHAVRGIARKGRELVGQVVVNAATIAQAHQFLHGAVRLGDIDFGLERRSHRSLFVSTKRSNKLAKLGYRGARKGPAKHTSPFQLARSRAPDQIGERELRLRAGMPRHTGASSIKDVIPTRAKANSFWSFRTGARHVHRLPRLGQCMILGAGWYKSSQGAGPRAHELVTGALKAVWNRSRAASNAERDRSPG